MRTFVVTLILMMASCLAACRGGPKATADQCWNSRLLQVKVGSAVFNFPKDAYDIGIPQSLGPDGQLVPVPNVLELDPEERLKDRLARFECNKKSTEPVVAGDEMTGAYIVDYSTDHSGAYFRFAVFQYKHASSYKGFDRFRDYVSDISDAAKVRFIGLTYEHNFAADTAVIATYAFRHRRFSLECHVWDDFKFPHKQVPDPRVRSLEPNSGAEKLEHTPRPPFLSSCSPKMAFRTDDTIIALSEPPSQINPKSGQRLVPPPEEWPALWARMAQVIASYRVDQRRGQAR